MVFSRNCERFAAQAEALRLFARLFDAPGPLLASVVDGLRPFYREDPEALDLLDGMAASLERDDPVVLQVDHARLFVGPFEMLAPPYASLYLESGERVDGETTGAISKFYHKHGLVLAESEKQPADHIGYLLEFLYWLAFTCSQDKACEDGAIDNLERFASAYVLSWTPCLMERIEAGARTGFYANLGKLGLEHLPIGDSLVASSASGHSIADQAGGST